MVCFHDRGWSHFLDNKQLTIALSTTEAEYMVNTQRSHMDNKIDEI
jgi:hypothetical protein